MRKILLSLGLLAVMMIFYRFTPSWQICWLPVFIILSFLASFGVGLYLTAVNVKYRDFRYVIPFGLQILLFMSPVIYPTSIVSVTWMNYLLALNPTYGPITLFRVPLIGNSDSPELIVISIASSLFLLAYGIYYFRKTEAFFADIA